jgi:hypothetical protein
MPTHLADPYLQVGTPEPARETSPSAQPEDNILIAQRLREMAELLDAEAANPYRAIAYRSAADRLVRLPRSVREIFDHEGVTGLDALPAIGPSIAAAIAEMLTSGHWSQLERHRRSIDPQSLLRTIPGVGPELARRLHETLGLQSLEALETAARDGRLEGLPQVGARRAAAIAAAVTQRLDQGRALRRNAPRTSAAPEPPVEWLLDIDREYRAAAAAGTLPKIAPRRFNPEGRAWLPVLHARRGDWQFTALFSNTARAHELDRVHDWVVLYGVDKDHAERQYTVVTAARGALAGRRVVRGREADCRAWYAAQ